MTDEDLERIRTSFVNEVLVHLPPGPDVSQIDANLFGVSASEIICLPGSYGFVSSFPAYRVEENRGVHFTDLRALHAILNSQSLRLYDLSNANDPNEYAHLARQFGATPENIATNQRRTYLLSMCEPKVLMSENALDLWRFYGREGWGAAIELRISIPDPNPGDYLLGRVHYQLPDYSDFRNRCIDFGRRHGDKKVNLLALMGIACLLQKHEAYRSEQEIRLVQIAGPDPQNPKWASDSDAYLCDFSRRNEVVNFHNLSLDSDETVRPKVHIDRIQLGFRHSEEFLKEFTEHVAVVLAAAERRLGRRIEKPSIELSPLRGIYR